MQVHGEVTRFGEKLPQISAQLFVGGTEVSKGLQRSLAVLSLSTFVQDVRTLREEGCAVVVATPGRLNDLMSRKALNTRQLEVQSSGVC